MKFSTILADCPWTYRSSGQNGSANSHYSTLTTDDLCALPVGELGTDESVLMTWTTYPLIFEAKRVMDAWGYTYVTGLPWIKARDSDLRRVHYGNGFWVRGAGEVVLLGKRKRSYRTNLIGLIAPIMEHSRKPDSVYELAECFPAPRLELFARRARPGWYALGDELPGDGHDIHDSLARHIDGSEPWVQATDLARGAGFEPEDRGLSTRSGTPAQAVFHLRSSTVVVIGIPDVRAPGHARQTE